MKAFRLDTGVDFEHPLGVRMAFIETDSRLSSTVLLAEI